MYSLETGLYPLAAIVVGALLTLIYFGVIRLKCVAHWAIGFIFAAMAFITVCSVVTPVRWVESDATTEVAWQPEPVALTPAPTVSSTDRQVMPVLKEGVKEPIAANQQMVKPFLHDVSNLFGWLWAAGFVGVLLSQLWQLLRLYRMRRNQEYISHTDGTKLYAVDGTHAFSFGRCVFIPRMFDDEMRRFMTIHELAHVQHRHFRWLCLFHVLLAFNWYNPFCWVLFRELHLQQELQVDGDVIRQGIDRTAYQYSLLRASLQGGGPVWILSAFGRKPITQRIAFMERSINAKGNMRRTLLSTLLALLVLSAVMVTACNNNEKMKEHPLMGWWRMDFTRNTDSDAELYPFGKQIAFYSYDTFLTISYAARNGKTLSFSFSTEEIRLKDDTLVNALGAPVRFEFIDENTFQDHWTRQPYQSAMPQGPEITDQWSRIPVDKDLQSLFEAFSQAKSTHGKKFDGMWVNLTQTVSGDAAKEYLIINDSLFLTLDYIQQEPKAFRAAGSGYCGVLREQDGYLQLGMMEPLVYSLPDADHLVVRKAGNEAATPHTYQRINMPADVKRMLQAPLTYAHGG